MKVFNLISRTNETRHIKWHETCKCKCRLDASAGNNKQRWNDDKCWCKCKELIDKWVCIKYILGILVIVSGNMICEYLDYKSFKCKKRLVDKLLVECNENTDEAKLTEITLFEHKNECACYYKVFIVLAVIELAIIIGIGAYFVYYK